MSKPKPDPKRIYVSIAVAFLWFLFLALWLFYYATSYSILQNIAILLVSLVIAGVIMIMLWVPWAMKHAD